LYISKNIPVDQYRISFIGAGRVSKALAGVLYGNGFEIREIVSKTEESMRIFAGLFNAQPKSDLRFSGCDIVIAAVPDDTLENVLKDISCDDNVIVAHTAGSIGLGVFPPEIKHVGVFYPLQTFSEGRRVEFRGIPFFIETSDKYTEEVLKNLAESIGGIVHFTDTRHRRLLHIAAVFACNFTNHMLTSGKKLSGEAGFRFDILRPLINETIMKAFEKGPEVSQTGPAVRLDKNTIERHLDLLSYSPEMQKLYREVTDSIISFYKKSI